MSRTEPTLLSAAWRYRYLVLVVTALTVSLGAAFLLLRPEESSYRAVTSVILQEPISAEGVASAEAAGGRFVASQIEIINSPVVAAEAASLLAELGHETAPETVLGSISVSSTPESPLVTITAVHRSPEIAVAIANQVAEGYRQISRRQATATAQSQLTQLSAQVEGIEERLSSIEEELREARQGEAGLAEIEQQAREAVQRIPELQAALLEATGDEAAMIREEIADLRDRLDVYQQVAGSLTGGPRQAALVEEQSLLVDRRAELQRLRDEISIEAELAPDALALVQPAEAAFLVGGAGPVRTLGVAFILGLALSTALAYFLAVSRRSFSGRTEPEAVLGAPLLADIPDFSEEHLESRFPTRDDPRSAAAEAFRFAASSLAVAARSRRIHSLAVLSPIQGHGKSTVLVNTALAAAVQGSSVLVVDCDFGNQQAFSFLLPKEGRAGIGLTEVLEGATSVDRAVQRVEFGDGVSIDVLGRGTRPTTATVSLQSDAARELFDAVSEQYDMVFVDTPPFLQVAYASRIAEMVQSVVIVIEHRSGYREAEDLVDRLDLVGTPVAGYIYNRSPLRREMTMTEGSMMDVIGDAGFVNPPANRRYKRRPERTRL